MQHMSAACDNICLHFKLVALVDMEDLTINASQNGVPDLKYLLIGILELEHL